MTPCDQLPQASATMPSLPCRAVPSWTLKPNNPSFHKSLLLGYLMIVTRWEIQPLTTEMCITSVSIRVHCRPSYSKHWASVSWRPVPRSRKGPQQDFCDGVLRSVLLWAGKAQSLLLLLRLPSPRHLSSLLPSLLSYLFLIHTHHTVMCICSVQTKKAIKSVRGARHLFSNGEG